LGVVAKSVNLGVEFVEESANGARDVGSVVVIEGSPAWA